MLGLITIKKHNAQLNELKKLLELEKLRSLYWNYKCLNDGSNPVIAGRKEDIEYITKSLTLTK